MPIPLTKCLFAKTLFAIGALQHNRKGISTGIKGLKTRDLLPSEIFLEKNKNVLALGYS